MPQPATKRLVTEAALDAAKDVPGGIAPLDDDGLLPEGNVPARLAETALSATIASRSFLGASFAFFGDSITNFGEGYPYYAQLLSQGAFVATHVASNPGLTSTALAALFDSQVIQASPKPTAAVILCGANDAQGSVPLATYRTNVEGMVAKCWAAGIAPVLCSLPPHNDDTDDSFARTYNAWLSRYCEANRIPLVDFYTLLVDQATGNWKTAYNSGDGLHPSNAANKAMGQLVVDTLSPLLTPRDYLLQPTSGTPNLQTNSNFLVDTNADGKPDGVNSAPVTGKTNSLVTDPAGFKWARMTIAGAAGDSRIMMSELLATKAGGTFAPGDRLRFAARVRTGQATNKCVLQLTQYRSNWTVAQNRTITAPVANGMTQQIDGVVVHEFTAHAEADFIVWDFVVGATNGTYDIGQPTLYNATALGLV